MDSKIKILIGILVVGIVLIGGWWIWENQYISIQSPESITQSVKISVGGNSKVISGIQLPIDENEAEKIVKKFCKSKNSGAVYGYDTIKEVDNEWKIQIVNMNGMCYAVVNVKSGETNCEKCDDVKLFPPFEEVSIITNKTEYE